jgi:hypothetical protein
LDPGVAPSLVFTIAVVAARVHRVRADHQHARADLRAAVRNPSQRDQEGQSQELALQLHSLFLGMHPNYDLISWVQHCKIGKYLFQSLVILCPNTTYKAFPNILEMVFLVCKYTIRQPWSMEVELLEKRLAEFG